MRIEKRLANLVSLDLGKDVKVQYLVHMTLVQSELLDSPIPVSVGHGSPERRSGVAGVLHFNI